MRAVAIWILVCAYLNCAGWILSAIHQLNFIGYAIALLVGFGAFTIWRKKTSSTFLPQIKWQKFFRRFRKPFPLAFLFIAILIFIGGAIHAPNNYDALTYRLPRVLNWLAAEHWFWIPTANERMNYSTTAWEWLTAPFFALLHSDRGIFLINIAGFLLMPGLLFSVFRRLGVARRVAWTWMWILPLAYGYAMQAGSIGNDLTGAVFALAAICFGLRSQCSGKTSDIWLAGLAAALMTGTKLSNLPLLLPCLVAVWPVLMKLRERLLASFAVAGIAILISAAPTMALNQIHAGSWTGDPNNSSGMRVQSPAGAFFGNSLLLLQQSLMPPVLPGAHKINEALNEKMPASWQQILKEKFPRYYLTGLNELPQEEAAGLGLGVTLLLLASFVATIFRCGKSKSKIFPRIPVVAFAAWIAVLFYMFKMGSEAGPRLMLPYYLPAIIPFLSLPSQNRLLQFRVWRIFILLAALSVLPAIILSPSRPLFPAVRMSEKFAQSHPASAAAHRLASVYSTYAHRNDSLAPIRAHLPDNAKKVGFIAGTDDTDYALWRPFGKRQVVYLQDEVKNSRAIPDDVEWIAVKQTVWHESSDLSLEEWAAQHQAQIIFSTPVTMVVAWGPETWCLLQIKK